MARDPIEDEDFRREICDWLQANGISPRETPAEPHASIANGQITILHKVQRNGCDVINPTRDGVVTETITMPLLVEPSPDVAEWLRPRCPTCGR